MAVCSTIVAAAVTIGVVHAILPRALGDCISIPVVGMSLPITASTGSLYGLCALSSEFTTQEYYQNKNIRGGCAALAALTASVSLTAN